MAFTGSTLVRVVAGPRGRWEVREPGGSRALCDAATQLDAIRLAPSVLTLGGQVQVLDAEGFLVRTLLVDPPADLKRPRWYVGPWTLFLALGLSMLVGGVIRIVRGTSDPFGWWAYLQAGFGAVAVVCAVLTRRRQRHERAEAVRRIEQGWLDTSGR